MSKVTFFSAVDRKGKRDDGKVMSSHPAWYHEPQIEELKEMVDSNEGRLERGEVPSEEIGYVKAETEKIRIRYNTIIASKPNIDPDKIKKLVTAAGEKIRESNPNRTEMMKGIASPQEEAKRMSTPCIKVPVELAELCEIALDKNGEVSRTQAVRMWQIGRKYLGENTNPEKLRDQR